MAGRFESRPTVRFGLWLGWLPGFLVVLGLFVITTPDNRFEAIDSYAYAYDAENRDLNDLYDTRLLLFHVSMAIVYRFVHALDNSVTAHANILAFSVLSASLCLILFARLLLYYLRLSLPASLLGVSYGFWRYSMEAEVYAPSLLLVIAVVYWVFAVEARRGTQERPTDIFPAAVLAAIAVLFYQPNAIPLFLATPILLLRRGGFPRLIVYCSIGGCVVLFGYLIAFLVDQGLSPDLTAFRSFVFQRFDEFELDETPLSASIKSLFALGSVILAGNWLFGIEWVNHLGVNVAVTDFEARVFAASKASLTQIYLPVLTVIAALLLGSCSVFTAAKAKARLPFDRRVIFLLLWFVLYSVVNGWLAPGSYEVWVMTLPPLFALFAMFVIEPCIWVGKQSVVIVLFCAVLLHNAVGGISIVYSSDGDHYRARATWLLENASGNDLVIFSTSKPLRDFLCYVGGLRAVHGPTREPCLRHAQADVGELVRTTRASGGRILVLEEFFGPSSAPERDPRYDPQSAAFSESIAERFRTSAKPVAQNEAGTTYLLP